MMRLARRIGGDRAVLGSLVVLVVFAVAAVAVSTQAAAVRTVDERTVAVARTQIETSLAVATQALQLDGGEELAADLTATIDRLRETHRSLRYGDPTAGLPGAGGTELASMFSQAEKTLADLVAATGRLLGGDDATAGSAVVDAATAYRSDMQRIAGSLSRAAASHAVVAKQINLVIVAAGFSIAIFLLMLAAGRRGPAGGAASGATRVAELDQLTGLVRRAGLRDRLIDAIHRRPEADTFVALLLIGVRTTSRTRSSEITDAIVLETARRLRVTVRSTDTVARTGRQQFAVVIDRSPRVEDAGRVAAKLIEALSQPVVAGGAAVSVIPAVGIALSPLDAPSGDDLLERAAVAQRVAEGRNAPAYRYFSPELRPIATSRGQLTESLREALTAPDQLWIAYQPKVRLRDGAMIGFEALLRWEHPTLGPLRPEDFVPLAEESDLIIELGTWVVEEVCRQLATWSRTRRRVVPVSVNVSTRQFRSGDLDTIVSSALTRHGLAPGLIEIELTEGVLIDDHERPLTHMEDLRRLGVRISVDDFGTGYSSLSYLKRFPIDTLKIDRSFISELHEDSEDAAISTAIIALAHSLELDVIAEGVETREQLDILIDLGCDAAQGYYFSAPVPAAEAEDLWQQRATVG